MTCAFCMKCGSEKLGALTTCGDCGFTPTDVVDRAKSVLLSDHFTDRATLRQHAKTIADGGEPPFDEVLLNENITVFEEELIKGRTAPPPPALWKTVLGTIGALVLPVAFFVILPVLFSLGERIAGRQSRPSAPLVTGTISELRLTDGDPHEWSGRRVAVYSTYLRFESANEVILIPRDRVQLLKVKPE